jgi:hypothetical protein
MRLWTVHPSYLDAKGLVALWREGLLAQKVLAGETRGYRHHPQLARFQAQSRPRDAIAIFLRAVVAEARRRGYHFDATKIRRARPVPPIAETRGQLMHEWEHLGAKLRARAPAVHAQWEKTARPDPHPLFRIVPGPIRDWEKSRSESPQPSRPARATARVQTSRKAGA